MTSSGTGDAAVESLPALEYHRLTSYAPGVLGVDDPRRKLGYTPMDFARFPPPFKTYPELGTVPVPPELDAALFLSAGVVRIREGTRLGTMLYRAAGSAGNLAPVELYVIRERRLHHYDPLAHALVPLGPAGTGPTTIVLTGVPWRTGWKYTERGFRHLYWDAGTLLAQLLAAAPEATVRVGFVDAEVVELLGIDGVQEVPLAAVVLGPGEPPLQPVADEPPPEGFLAHRPVHFPMVTGAQRAGNLTDAAAVSAWQVSTPTPRDVPDLTFGSELDAVVRRRGSTRQFDPAAHAPRELLVEAFGRASHPIAADFLGEQDTLLEHYVLIHAVEGFAPGMYRWSGRDFELLYARGDTRDVGFALTLNQALGRDGCFTAFHCADLEAVTARLGDRGYRAALLEAGIVEGRLHLTSFALGFGATGLTYYDYETRTAFGTRHWPLLVTAVGKPAYRSRPGGTPGHPTALAAPPQRP